VRTRLKTGGGGVVATGGGEGAAAGGSVVAPPEGTVVAGGGTVVLTAGGLLPAGGLAPPGTAVTGVTDAIPLVAVSTAPVVAVTTTAGLLVTAGIAGDGLACAGDGPPWTGGDGDSARAGTSVGVAEPPSSTRIAIVPVTPAMSAMPPAMAMMIFRQKRRGFPGT
jgi:hypothetical protein